MYFTMTKLDYSLFLGDFSFRQLMILSTQDFHIQWWLQIREFSFTWLKIAKMENEGISNTPLFDLDFLNKI